MRYGFAIILKSRRRCSAGTSPSFLNIFEGNISCAQHISESEGLFHIAKQYFIKNHLFRGFSPVFLYRFLLFYIKIMLTGAISTNFCSQLSFLCEYYKKVVNSQFLRLILRFIWHTIGDERILEMYPKRFDRGDGFC